MNLKSKIGTTALLLVGGFSGFITSNTVKAVTDGSFNFSVPNNGNLVQGCNYSADIRINTGSNDSNSADIIIDYDPTKIEIIDSDTSVSGKQIKPGNAYQSYFGNQVDEGIGKIRLTGASFNAPINGQFIFASINFKSKPGVTAANFIIDFDGAGETNSLDSNISIAQTSLDALGSVQNGILTFSNGSCVGDTSAPNVTFIDPTNGELDVPVDRVVRLNLTDNLSGVDISTLEVLVNGQLYTSTSPEMEISGTSTNYDITLHQTNDINTDTPSTILVKVRDFAGNLRQSYITFNNPSPPVPTTTPGPTQPPGTPGPTLPPVIITATPRPTVSPIPEDRVGPQIEFINPISRETILENEEISFRITDEGDGINTSSLQVLINEKKYTINDSALKLEGTVGGFIVRIRDNLVFSKVSSSYLSVFVSDMSGNSAVSNIIFNIPQAVVTEKDNIPTVCNIDDQPNVDPIQNAPLSNTVQELQKSLEDIAPDFLKPIIKEAGVFGVATFVAALPFLVWAASAVISFISGGLFFPFIIGLFASKKKLFGVVFDENTKKGLVMTSIKIFDVAENHMVKHIVTTFKGRFTLNLPAGAYRLDFDKDGYLSRSIELHLEEEGYVVNTVNMTPLESHGLVEHIQFRVFKIDPKIISVYFGLLLSFINVLYVRTLLAMFILGLMIIGGVYVTVKFRKKKQYSGQ